MDVVDAPTISQRHHPRGLAHEDFTASSYKAKPKNTFQNELGAKLRARRQQGLTADVTSDETEDEEVNDYLSQYRVDPSRQKKDRPQSAKRRTRPDANPDISLNSTLRPGEGNKWLKQKGPKAGFSSSMPPLLASPKDALYNEHARTSPSDSPGFGTRFQSPRDSLSGGGSLKSTPRDSLTSSLGPQLERTDWSKHQKDFETKEYKHHKESGTKEYTSKMPSLTKTPPPRDEEISSELAKQELLFGKKTPTMEDKRKSPIENQEKKPWQPPSFRKASPVQVEQEGSTRFPTAGEHHGRMTPLQSDLGTIDESKESPKPTPRARQKSGDVEKPVQRIEDFRESQYTKATKVPEPVPRPKPRSDIFGKMAQKTLDISDIEEDTPKSRSRAQIEQQKAQSRTFSGRKSPAGRKTQEHSTKQRSRTPTEESLDSLEREPSLLDFMTDTGESSKPKHRERGKGEEYQSEGILRAKPRKFTDTSTRKSPEPVLRAATFEDTVIPDYSSVCADVEQEPRPKSASADLTTTKSPTRQRSDKKKIDAAIDIVANSQKEDGIMKPIHPAENIDSSVNLPIHKPKPWHTLPGAPNLDSEVSFDSTQSIRQAVYEEWRKKKNKTSQKQKVEMTKMNEEKKKKEEKEKEEKKKDLKECYEAWQKKKIILSKEKNKEKNLKDKDKKNEEEEKLTRVKEAEKNFKMWMERKDVIRPEVVRKKKEVADEEKLKIVDKNDREKLSVTAYRGWKDRKDQIIIRNKTIEKEDANQKKANETNEAKKRERTAVEHYDDWMTNKEQQEKNNKVKKKQSVEDIDFRPAWSPASQTIPFRR